MAESKVTDNFKTAIEIAIKISIPVMLGVSAFVSLKLLDHEVRITAIENSRYTQSDAKIDAEKQRDRYDSIMSEITKIRESQARFESRSNQ